MRACLHACVYVYMCLCVGGGGGGGGRACMCVYMRKSLLACLRMDVGGLLVSIFVSCATCIVHNISISIRVVIRTQVAVTLRITTQVAVTLRICKNYHPPASSCVLGSNTNIMLQLIYK